MIISLLIARQVLNKGFRTLWLVQIKRLVVTTPEVSAVRDADRIIGLLEKQKDLEPPKLIINRIRNHMMKNGDMLEIDEIAQHLSIELFGIVADDDEVIQRIQPWGTDCTQSKQQSINCLSKYCPTNSW